MEKDSPKLIEYPISPQVKAFTTCRPDNSGEGPYHGFNITHYCGDHPEHVKKCRERLCTRLHITDDHLLLPHQVHGTDMLTVDADFFSLTPEERHARLEDIDALMTDIRNTCIGISTADCLPLLFYDSEHHCIAAAHAGWRGTVGHIARKTVEKMVETYGTTPEHLHVILGPAITAESFEVGDEVCEAFSKAGFPLDRIAHSPNGNHGKYHLDLHAANTLELEEAGVDLFHIQVLARNTYNEQETFFSARRLGIHSGRIFSGIMLQ